MKKRQNKLISVYLMFGLILLVIGFSYAFFIYNKTGLYTHTITGGKMKVIYDELAGNNITIENAYPRTDEEALIYGLEFEFTVTGYNESEKNIYYAVEIDYGSDVTDKERFLDRDMKLTLYENDELIFENQIYDNLDNQDIHYGYIKSGTSEDLPTINDYKLRLWINDNVIISDTLSDDLSTWGDYEWDWFYSRYDSDYDAEAALYNACGESEECYLSDLGMSVYTSDEFANHYANFKVNIRADLSYDDVGYLTYDANGGTNTPEKTSLLTNIVTMQKPVMENKGFLGWSSDPLATSPEYFAGQSYSGEGKLLYAVYGNTKNVMSDLASLDSYKTTVTEVYFINDTEENIDESYNEALENGYAVDLTLDNQGSVKSWIEDTILYIASEGTIYLSTGKSLFNGWTSLTNIDFSNADTSMITDMSYMFGGANYIYEMDLSMFNTSNVTDMSYMFWNDKAGTYDPIKVLRTLNLDNFDTSKVEDMSYMFYYCSYLENLDLSHFDTNKVTSMSSMFYYCMSLMNLDISSFNTSNVMDMREMFYYCESLSSLDVSLFNTSKVEDMYQIFGYCSNLSNLDVSSFDTSLLTDMSSMFYHCSSLQELDVSSFDTSNVTDMSRMFYNCKYLTSLNVSRFVTNNVEDMSSMFYECSGLKELDVSNFDTSRVTSMSSMFYNCSGLRNLDVSNFDTGYVQWMTSMFSGCSGLSELDVSNFDTTRTYYIYRMFAGCSNLTELDLSNFNTSGVEDMDSMFANCKKLKSLDLSNFNMSSVTDIGSYSGYGMFYNCTSLTYLDISSFDFSTITKYQYAFQGMSANAQVYVNDETAQTKILGISATYRPAWTTNNVIFES